MPRWRWSTPGKRSICNDATSRTAAIIEKLAFACDVWSRISAPLMEKLGLGYGALPDSIRDLSTCHLRLWRLRVPRPEAGDGSVMLGRDRHAVANKDAADCQGGSACPADRSLRSTRGMRGAALLPGMRKSRGWRPGKAHQALVAECSPPSSPVPS